MLLTPEQIEETNRRRAWIAEISGVETYPAPLLEVTEVGHVRIWFAAKDGTFVSVEEHGDEGEGDFVYAVESFEPSLWGPGPHNL